MTIDVKKLTVLSAAKQLRSGVFTAVDLAKAYLEEISKKNKDVNAYLEVYSDVISQAEAGDKILKEQGDRAHILTGIPCAIKDNILNQDRIASASSRMLENYTSPYDAAVIGKLKRAGAVFLGRTNMDEFAMGGSTENSAFGVTKNPYDTSRVSGGSSGGSAAALAMDGCLFSIGSDTGGSIRQPASFCGVVGLKPTYGAVSRYGLMAMGSSLDQIGPITKSVTDAQIIFEAIKGRDPLDGTTIDDDTYNPKRIGQKKPVLGVPRDILGQTGGIDKAVLESFEAALKSFREKGYEIKDVSLPNSKSALMVYYIVMPAEVSTNMSRYDGMRFGLHKDGKDGIEDYFESRRAGLGKEVVRRILLGTYVLSSGYYDAYYNRANAVRKMIVDDYNKAFESVDIILTPTTPSPAFKIGEKTSDPLTMYLEDVFTVTANLTGMPAMSIPCGTSIKDGASLPLGLQLTARHGDEEALFTAGKDFLSESEV